MEITVVLSSRLYRYKNTGSFYTWVDHKNRPVPVLIHTKLREKALAEGADISHFLSVPKPPRSEDLSPPDEREEKQSSKKKSNLTGGFNPFNVGG
jgi:hypothetical protein